MSETREKAAAMHEATDIGTKLTKAQREFLHILGEGERSCLSTYRPARHLLELALAERLPMKGMRSYNMRIGLTPAGSALLRSLQEKSHG